MTKKKPGSTRIDWRSTPIVAYKPNGEIAGYFDNPRAAIAIGVNSGNLYRVLKGLKNQCDGFKWMAESRCREIWSTDPEQLKWEHDKFLMHNDGKSEHKHGFRKGYDRRLFLKKYPRDYTHSDDVMKNLRKSCENMRNVVRQKRAAGIKVNAGKQRPVLNITTGEAYDSITEGAKAVGASISALYGAIVNGHRCRGCTWKFINT